MSTGEATYKAWVDKILNDLGPDSMETPIKVALHTDSTDLIRHVTYRRPRDLFADASVGVIEIDQIATIQISDDIYVREGNQWTGPIKPTGHPVPIPPIRFPTVEAMRAEAATETDVDDEYEEVENPAHYDVTIDGRQYRAVDLIEAMDLDWHTGSALKYIVRAGAKPGAEASTDLRKAAWYLNRRADFLDKQ